MGLVASLFLTVKRLEALSTPCIAATAMDTARPEERIKRPVTPKIEAKRKEKPRPKTATPKAVDRMVFQFVDGVAWMKLTYVMREGKKIPTINAVARFSVLEEAEEFRRRLRHSGINASVISKGAYGFEVVVPKDELEKLTPKEKKP